MPHSKPLLRQRDFVFPFELVDEDYAIRWLRIDSDGPSRGKAKAFFAQEWGVDFKDVRVSKVYFAPPAPECDECGLEATCGGEITLERQEAYKVPLCDECQRTFAEEWRPEFAPLESFKPLALEQVEPYDGFPVEPATPQTPNAQGYWKGEER